MKTYITKSGELWDEIAFKIWKDCKYVEDLMNENPDKLNYSIFPAGVKLKVPEINKNTETNLPAWR